MSAVIVSVVKLTFGLLSKKVRAHCAQRLQNGGLADKEFRKLIVSELDDIKDRLDALGLTELDNGISCLNQGVVRLNLSFSDSVDGTGQSQLPNAIKKQSEMSLTSMGPSSEAMPDIEQVLALAHVVGTLKSIPNKRYELAEESFKNAARDAGKAFHNRSLSIEARILACQVRIASGILQHLADPDLAACDCLQYLKELHKIPEIFEIFDVYANGGFKSIFSRERRAEIVESVITINLSLLDFITTFTTTEKPLSIFKWPLIECDANVYHPIYYEVTTMKNELTSITPPWCIKVRDMLQFRSLSAVNSKGDIILCPDPTKCFLAKFDRETGKLEQFNIPALDKGEEEDIKCNYLAVDEDDTVYLLTRYSQETDHYNLSVCDSNGKVIHHQPVEFLTGKECRCFGITKDKRLVFCCEFEQNDHNVYICDRNGQLKNSFPARISDNLVVKDMFSSNYNEIMLVAVRKHSRPSSIYLHIYSVEGRSERDIKLTLPAGSGSPSSCTVRYNYRSNKIICLVRTMMGNEWRYLQFCTETGELQRSCGRININHLGLKPNLSSHPKGNVALVCQNGALFMQ
ncbi:Hypothetical predicted protein [Paramuricea clavata]|uniref:Uncharacterized protein n=1 Tax=Paramuricea clavata TaxID=317549 RepID=A0A6S7I8V3_PARCT|nr:Hypothetical predicted protein [Paramuricea clavata]